VFKLALRNLLRNKRRTILTVLSLVSALLLLCFLTAFLDVIATTEGAAANRIVVRSSVSLATLLPEAYWERLKTLPHVEAVTPLNWFQGIYKDAKMDNFFPRFSSDPATLFAVFPLYQMSVEEKKAWAAERGAFIAGKTLADKYHWKIGDQIFIKGDIYPVDLNLTLRGIYTVPDTPSQERQIFFHRKYLEEALKNPGLVGTYFLKIDSPQSVTPVVKASEAMFANSDFQVRAETEKAFQLSFMEMMGNIRLLFGAIGLAVVISIFFITANTMAMAARERTTEVGVLKTLGFRNGQVMGMVILESLAVGILGAACGLTLAALSIKLLAAMAGKFFPLFGTFRMTPRTWGVGLGVGLVIGLLSGLVPAVSASRLRIANALRRV
jgi:putative ABC transport system permease protein